MNIIFRLCGESPFLGDDNQETFQNICQVNYDFDEEYFEEISEDAKSFVSELLIKKPRYSPTIKILIGNPPIYASCRISNSIVTGYIYIVNVAPD